MTPLSHPARYSSRSVMGARPWCLVAPGTGGMVPQTKQAGAHDPANQKTTDPMKTQNREPLDRLADNLINGNISDARKQARRHSEFRLSMFFRQCCCWPLEKSMLAAHFLKTGEGWQAYCDSPSN
jgi:hypothetical protein